MTVAPFLPVPQQENNLFCDEMWIECSVGDWMPSRNLATRAGIRNTAWALG